MLQCNLNDGEKPLRIRIATTSSYEKNENAEEFLQEIREDSTFQSDVEATANDRYLILTTCEYQFQNARYAVIGKLTPME